MNLRKVLTCGETAVDRSVLLAAAREGLETGGCMPEGFQTSQGPNPDFAKEYGLVESEEPYRVRVGASIAKSDGVICYNRSSNEDLVHIVYSLCQGYGVTLMLLPEAETNPNPVVEWLSRHDVETLFVVGDDEAHSPNLGESAFLLFMQVFKKVVEMMSNDFEAVCDESNNPPESIMQGMINVDITIGKGNDSE